MNVEEASSQLHFKQQTHLWTNIILQKMLANDAKLEGQLQQSLLVQVKIQNHTLLLVLLLMLQVNFNKATLSNHIAT